MCSRVKEPVVIHPVVVVLLHNQISRVEVIHPIGNQPTYFMAMKDAAQLVKKYAMVNVQQYQVVATGERQYTPTRRRP